MARKNSSNKIIDMTASVLIILFFLGGIISIYGWIAMVLIGVLHSEIGWPGRTVSFTGSMAMVFAFFFTFGLLTALAKVRVNA